MVRLLEPWRSRLLWLSLGLNLFGAALIGTAAVMRPRHGGDHPGPPSFDRMIDRISERLEPADAAVFRTAMAKERPWYELGQRKAQGARDSLAQALTREPYDPASTAAAITAMQEQVIAGSSRFNESLALAVGALSPHGRSSLAAIVQQGRP